MTALNFLELLFLLFFLKLLLDGAARLVSAVTEAKEKARERRREQFSGWEPPLRSRGRGASDEELRKLAGDDLLRGLREMESKHGNTARRRR